MLWPGRKSFIGHMKVDALIKEQNKISVLMFFVCFFFCVLYGVYCTLLWQKSWNDLHIFFLFCDSRSKHKWVARHYLIYLIVIMINKMYNSGRATGFAVACAVALPQPHTLFILSHVFIATTAPKPAKFNEMSMLSMCNEWQKYIFSLLLRSLIEIGLHFSDLSHPRFSLQAPINDSKVNYTVI